MRERESEFNTIQKNKERERERKLVPWYEM